ncbi:MAG: PEP-CTERM sorting domain-containing protein [Porticoccaceae bacterium]
MKGITRLVLVLAMSIWSIGAYATLIDNSAWTGDTNNGWVQSAQTLTFATDVTLDSFGWWLGQDNTHEVSVVEWSNGPGAVLFSSTQAWSSGFNEIFPAVALSAGVTYAVQFNYLGAIGFTVQYNFTNDYANGEWWLLSGSWFPWNGGNDIRFIANFTEAGGENNNVPVPATLALFGLGLLCLGGVMRKSAV